MRVHRAKPADPAAQLELPFHERDLEADVGEPDGGPQPGDPAADDERLGSVSTTIGSSGVVWRVRPIPARTSAVAFSVAAASSSVWTQEHCSRMLTCVYSYGLRPARAATPRNV